MGIILLKQIIITIVYYYVCLNWLSLLKVERQIDSDQLIYVQGILGAESRAETRGERRRQSRKQSAGRDETRLERETQSERENHEQ